MKILMFVLIFFLLAGLIIVNNNDLHLSNKVELKNFSELYTGWLGQTYSNFFSITGHFTKLEWFPK